MRLFRRKPKTIVIDMDVARRAGEAVNRGDVDEATRIVNTTAHPREHAFAAFRFIRNDEA
jgi:hypothetical protein